MASESIASRRTSSGGIVVYETARSGGLSVWATMAADIARCRTLIWYLAARDFKAQYRQSVLGYASAVGPPVLAIAVFTFVARRRLLPIGDTTLPYPIFIGVGMTIWGLFSGIVNAATGSLGSAASLINKMRFPREAVVFASLAQPLTDTAIRTLLVAVLLIVYAVPVTVAALLVPIVIVPLLLFAVGLGFALAVLNALSRDVRTTVGLTLQAGLLLTPVVYPPPTEWPFVLINYLNPVSPFVIATHDLLAGGCLSMPLPLAAASLLGALTFLVGWRLFRLAQPLVAERL